MNRHPFFVLVIGLVVFSLIGLACSTTASPTEQSNITEETPQDQSAPSPRQESTESVAPSVPETQPEEQSTESQTAEPETPPEDSAGEVGSCQEEECVLDGSFWLRSPLGTQDAVAIDPSMRYGLYQRSTRDAQRGVEFVVSTGTPVVAVADGEVIVAGDDTRTAFGSAARMYGNLVIIEHRFPNLDKSVYTLYAHLSEVTVEEGDDVSAGDEIGKVGATGNVSGSVLHFEVRLGENVHKAARNPELWLEPVETEGVGLPGALAGRIVDANGEFLEVKNIVIEQISGEAVVDTFYTRTYSGESLIGQEPWAENFALSGLPDSTYQITFLYNGFQQRMVEVKEGKLTVFTIVVP